MPFSLLGTPVQTHARRVVTGFYEQVGVTLIIPQQDIVRRVVALNEIRFQHQRFGFSVSHHHFDAFYPRQHRQCFWAVTLLLKIRADATFEIAGLAHVEQTATWANHLVNTGLTG